MQRDIIRLLKNSNFAFLREIIGARFNCDLSLYILSSLIIDNVSCRLYFAAPMLILLKLLCQV